RPVRRPDGARGTPPVPTTPPRPAAHPRKIDPRPPPTGRFRSRPYGGLRRARVDSQTARPTARPDHRASHRDAEPLRLRFDVVPSRTDQPERELPVLEDDLVLGQVSVLPIPHGGAHAEIEDRIGCQFGRGHPELASALALFDQPSKPAF